MSLKEYYKKEVLPKLKEEFSYKSDFAAPCLKKVVINVGFGKNTKNKDYIKILEESLRTISGQKPLFIKAKKSIASFKLREGATIGVKVTLRGRRMYDFLEKLINISFPRTRDFRGISSKSVDNTGNLTIGFKDNSSFPEIEIQDLDKMHGMEVCISTSAKTRKEGLEMFKLLKFPFKNIK